MLGLIIVVEVVRHRRRQGMQARDSLLRAPAPIVEARNLTARLPGKLFRSAAPGLSPASQPEDPIEDRDANERRDPACEGHAQCDLRRA
jgi:hypothetical protein